MAVLTHNQLIKLQNLVEEEALKSRVPTAWSKDEINKVMQAFENDYETKQKAAMDLITETTKPTVFDKTGKDFLKIAFLKWKGAQ